MRCPRPPSPKPRSAALRLGSPCPSRTPHTRTSLNHPAQERTVPAQRTRSPTRTVMRTCRTASTSQQPDTPTRCCPEYTSTRRTTRTQCTMATAPRSLHLSDTRHKTLSGCTRARLRGTNRSRCSLARTLPRGRRRASFLGSRRPPGTGRTSLRASTVRRRRRCRTRAVLRSARHCPALRPRARRPRSTPARRLPRR